MVGEEKQWLGVVLVILVVGGEKRWGSDERAEGSRDGGAADERRDWQEREDRFLKVDGEEIPREKGGREGADPHIHLYNFGKMKKDAQ